MSGAHGSGPEPTPRRIAGRLDPAAIGAVQALVATVTAADGVAPLDEQARLRLRRGGDDGDLHLLVDGPGPAEPAPAAGGRPGTAGPSGAGPASTGAAVAGPSGAGADSAGPSGVGPAVTLLGYGHLSPADDQGAHADRAEVVVHPAARRHGIGRALTKRLLAAAGGRPVQLWAHGDHPGARALADALGFTPARRLLTMSRRLDRLPPATPPPGVRLRAFRQGVDDADWLALNARAFANHPEQGGWTARDLAVRVAEPWFDPAGFLLAEADPPDGRLLGAHWTKVHGRPGEERVGEVYVLAVDPAAQGAGLGRALALAGLHHLAGLGLTDVMLYVDADNTAARALYTRLGFTESGVDVTYRHPGSAPDGAHPAG